MKTHSVPDNNFNEYLLSIFLAGNAQRNTPTQFMLCAYTVCKEHRAIFMKLLFRGPLRNEVMLALRSGLHHWIYASIGEKKLAPLGRIKLQILAHSLSTVSVKSK